MPLIGTITRVVWLLAFFWLIYFAIGWAFPQLNWDEPLLWFAIGGLAVADLIHVLLDLI